MIKQDRVISALVGCMLIGIISLIYMSYTESKHDTFKRTSNYETEYNRIRYLNERDNLIRVQAELDVTRECFETSKKPMIQCSHDSIVNGNLMTGLIQAHTRIYSERMSALNALSRGK